METPEVTEYTIMAENYSQMVHPFYILLVCLKLLNEEHSFWSNYQWLHTTTQLRG